MGITEEQLRDLSHHADSEHFDAQQKAALELAVAMTRTPAEVSDALFARLTSLFPEPALVELVTAIAIENFRARWNRPFDVAAEGFSEGAFCPLPEPHV